MALITRISRLFTADFHAVLDRIEEPDVLLKHAIREMEQALHDTELRLNKLVREQRQLAAREAQAKATFDKLDGELDLCFESGEESLARNLIRKKLSEERHASCAAMQRSAVCQAIDELNATIEEQRLRLDDMRQKAELLLDDSDLGDCAVSQSVFVVTDDDVDVAFLEEKRKRSTS